MQSCIRRYKIIFILVAATLCASAYPDQKPEKDFPTDIYLKHAAPDYSNLKYWAAHPGKPDPSDSVPAFIQDAIKDSSVDVFFLHPTTYTGRFDGWNADIDDEKINDKTDMGTILFQASVFSARCRIFAPRYRQAHLRAFFTKDTAQARQALDFAYQDLRTAFQYYLDHWNHGRPIIIASHSQGTYHAIRLIKEFFDGKPLQKQLVCAYLVGYQIKKDAFKYIPVGNSPTSTGCIVGWRSFKDGYVPPFVKKEAGNCICVNPVTWTTDNAWSDPAKHPGFVGRKFNTLLAPHALSCGIAPEANILWIRLPRYITRRFGGIKNYHIADYNLFYINIRQNVTDRVDAWNRRQH